eukprot:gnl/TRDRNA2_/TRDRNA2_132842_c0_seq1.p1 gnl/TRDRNA2_/TRDRNA2_132842_c0~~gnl/TRDRNA2_/TRDRNA2_132842_c0_seq1.p1  ORF type:complete len:460 (+),score=49.70 gnl/TRDRNA2_/TRDRNA2_132842_c0_seq1:105-1484(+)
MRPPRAASCTAAKIVGERPSSATATRGRSSRRLVRTTASAAASVGVASGGLGAPWSPEKSGKSTSNQAAAHPAQPATATDCWKVSVNFSVSGAPLAELRLHPTDMVGQLRRVVAKAVSSTAEIAILHQQEVLEDKCTLADSGLSDGVLVSAILLPARLAVTASSDRSACIWSLESGECLQQLLGHEGIILSAVFSPDRMFVLTASGDSLAKLWRVSDGVCSQTYTGHSDAVRSAHFSPDGCQVLTASNDKTAKVWNTHGTGECIGTLVGHVAAVRFATFSPDGNLAVTASDDRTARIWCASSAEATWIAQGTLQGHRDFVLSASFNPTDATCVLTASNDRTARIWSLDASESPHRGECVQTLAGHTGAVRSAMFCPDGISAVTASDDRSARIWHVGTGQCLRRFEGHVSILSSAFVSPDGKYVVTASCDRTARVWRSEDGECVQTFAGHTGIVSFAACT